MLIRPGDNLAGVPLRHVRDFVRKNRSKMFLPIFIAESLGITAEETNNLVEAMIREGFLERSDGEPGLLEVGPQGGTLAGASAARPISRKKADRLIRELLQRTLHVNSSIDYSRRVRLVVVFGSYLDRSKDQLSDVDIAVGLADKWLDHNVQEEHDNNVCKVAYDRGQSFRSYLERLFFPEQSVKRFLKSRSTGISLHCAETERPIWSSGPHEILFQSD